MNQISVPLVFKPVYKRYLWGGKRIATHFKRSDTPEVCAESWETSAHVDGHSVVAEGVFAGHTLADLAARHGAPLTGTAAVNQNIFPLLCKIIEAHDLLSVQVHPNDDNAHLTGGAPKTEVWVVLDATPDAKLYAGLKPDTTPEQLRTALAQGEVASYLNELPVKAGQALFIPGGMVHAIGKGCLIYEVQQNSNTTWRLFDWNRIDADNQPRQLHIEESFKSIDWNLPPPAICETPLLPGMPNSAPQWFDIAACKHFKVSRLDLTRSFTRVLDGTTFNVLFVIDGSVTIESGGHNRKLSPGDSLLLPAALPLCKFTPQPTASIIVTTLNPGSQT